MYASVMHFLLDYVKENVMVFSEILPKWDDPDERLDRSWGCVLAAQTANHALGYIKSSVASRSSEMILPFYSTLVRIHLQYCAQLWDNQHKKG
ncbi:hypothetical protein BTVI_10443 [Pitangus sulphuratus]|nr:hypothetical protein BTVI_10443 [Pitangus sulphuratus]